MKYIRLAFFYLLLVSCNQNIGYDLSEEVPLVDSQRELKVLSAFFGLDNDLPKTAITISPQAPGMDGMPVVLSHEIDPETLSPDDFRIQTAKGEYYNVDFVTLRPAREAFELRTILLVGEYGDYPDNEPVEVEIIGDLVARSGQNYKGQKIAVTPLEKGPFISYAEYFKLDDEYPYVAEGRGCDCPIEDTEIVVRAVWAGGVRALNGEELGENELEKFMVTLMDGEDSLKVHPFQIADLNDDDNNVDLCIRQKGIPILISTEKNTAIDPRDDANEYTEIEVISRW